MYDVKSFNQRIERLMCIYIYIYISIETQNHPGAWTHRNGGFCFDVNKWFRRILTPNPYMGGCHVWSCTFICAMFFRPSAASDSNCLTTSCREAEANGIESSQVLAAQIDAQPCVPAWNHYTQFAQPTKHKKIRAFLWSLHEQTSPPATSPPFWGSFAFPVQAFVQTKGPWVALPPRIILVSHDVTTTNAHNSEPWGGFGACKCTEPQTPQFRSQINNKTLLSSLSSRVNCVIPLAPQIWNFPVPVSPQQLPSASFGWPPLARPCNSEQYQSSYHLLEKSCLKIHHAYCNPSIPIYTATCRVKQYPIQP